MTALSWFVFVLFFPPTNFFKASNLLKIIGSFCCHWASCFSTVVSLLYEHQVTHHSQCSSVVVLDHVQRAVTQLLVQGLM